jgi:hypothetical protein
MISKDKILKFSIIISIFSLMALLFIALIHFTITNIGLNSDEGCYIMAAKKAISGKIPYRDFGYTQTPLLPYINGFLMRVFGFGQLEHRIINACWGLLALMVSMLIVLKKGNLVSFFICGWVLVTTPMWVSMSCFSPYGASIFFMTVTGVLICSSLPFNKKVILFSIFGGLAIACRLTVAPAVFVLWLYLIFVSNDFKQRLIVITSFITIELIIFLPFIFASPENFIFWNMGYHIKTTLERRLPLEYLLMLPSIFILIISGLPAAAILKKNFKSPEVAVLIAATIAIFIQIIPKANYGTYAMPFVPMCAIGGSIILSDVKWNKYIYLLLLLFPILYFTPYSPIKYIPYPINHYIDRNWVNTLNKAEYFLREHTRANGYILTPFPILAIQADRNVFDGMEMGMFGVTDEIEENRAKKLHLMRYDELINIVKTRKAEAVVLNNYPSLWNFWWSVPSLAEVDQLKRNMLFTMLDENYRIAYMESPLVILVPK